MKTDNIDNFDLIYNTAIGIRYHMHRQRVYERNQRIITSLSLIASSGALIALVESHGLAKWFALSITILQSFDLVVDNRGMSQVHNDLRKRYIRLNQKIGYRKKIGISENEALREELHSIETEEPPIKITALKIAENDAKKYLDAGELEDICWIKKLISYCF